MNIFRQVIFSLFLIFMGCVPNYFLDTESNVLENSYGNPVLWRTYPIIVTVDSTLEINRQNAIINAINYWNFLVNEQVFTYQFNQIRHQQHNDLWITTCELETSDEGKQILGRITRYFIFDSNHQPISVSTADICILFNLNNDYWYSVVLHELGHALSLNHDSTQKSIMHYHVQHFGQAPTQEDISFIRNSIQINRNQLITNPF